MYLHSTRGRLSLDHIWYPGGQISSCDCGSFCILHEFPSGVFPVCTYIAVGPQRGRCDLRGGDCYDQVIDWDSISREDMSKVPRDAETPSATRRRLGPALKCRQKRCMQSTEGVSPSVPTPNLNNYTYLYSVYRTITVHRLTH